MVALVNTFAIYEQFRTVLGDEAAKGFAQTLGTMIDEASNAATKEDVRSLRESVETSITRLDGSVSRLETAVANLAEAQARTEARVEELAQGADVVATGLVEGQPTYIVGEVSYTADADDVMRAARRAACLVKAGLPAIPLVACESISPQTTIYARQEGVRVWVEGILLEA